MLFSKATRPIVKEENPDATFGEIGTDVEFILAKLIGEKWKNISASEKKVLFCF